MLDRSERRQQRRDLEDRAVQEGRIPPGQSLTLKWPVLDTGIVPTVDLATWRLQLYGLVHEPCELTWADFRRLPQSMMTSDIHCVTRWTKLDNTWEGVRARDVLSSVDLEPAARYVMVHAPGYTANLPLQSLYDDDVLFAVRHDGRDLATEHGGPARLVVPKRYFWKSVKWVSGLEFLAENAPGYWERLGYHMDGDPWQQQRFGG
ncbi:MAG: sulfite oxidase-like oxidoreductase [Chloroflexota bacterium]